MTSLKSLDPDYSSKNHMRKFLRALLLKWRANVMAIKEAKDLATLPLDELVENLKVYKMILENDGVGSKTTKEKVKSLALKAKVTREQTSDDSDSQGGSDEDINEEEAEAFNLMDRNFRKLFCKGFGRGNQFGNGGNRFVSVPKPKENKAFVGGAWSDSKDGNEHQNDATCLMEIDSQEIVDSGCTKHMTGNRRLFTSYKEYDGGHVIFRSNLKGKVSVEVILLMTTLQLPIVRIKRLIDDLRVTAAQISLLEDMDSESAHMVVASKVPMLKPENGNTAPKITVVEGVEKAILYKLLKEKGFKRAIEKRNLNQTFDRLQKLVSQLEILGETLSLEDMNRKLLRSLSPEWNTHVVVWRNKPELEIMSMDDLYNNLKVYEPEVKGASSSSTSIQNMAFMSFNNSGSTNEAVNTAPGVSAASTQNMAFE
ncbi:hypothetical protein Tco_0620879 [Tanacetum coccineum]